MSLTNRLTEFNGKTEKRNYYHRNGTVSSFAEYLTYGLEWFDFYSWVKKCLAHISFERFCHAESEYKGRNRKICDPHKRPPQGHFVKEILEIGVLMDEYFYLGVFSLLARKSLSNHPINWLPPYQLDKGKKIKHDRLGIISIQ